MKSVIAYHICRKKLDYYALSNEVILIGRKEVG